MKLEEFLQAFEGKFTMREQDTESLSSFKAGPMKFNLKSYYVEGLGNLSWMTGTAMMGMMKMETFVLNPFEADMPLFSYDRIHAMGNETILLEFYNTCLDETGYNTASEGVWDKAVAPIAALEDKPAESRWYDSLKMPGTLCKVAKKNSAGAMDEAFINYLNAFLSISEKLPNCDKARKADKAKVYSEGLLEHGGASTDPIIKAIGREQTEKLYREFVFGTH